MCAKPGKILSSSVTRIIRSQSTVTVEERKHGRYVMKLAIRRSVDDMIEILRSGDKKASTLLIGEIERLLADRSWQDAESAVWMIGWPLNEQGGDPFAWLKNGGVDVR